MSFTIDVTRTILILAYANICISLRATGLIRPDCGDLMDNHLREEILTLHAHICEGLADPNRIMILYTLAENARNVTELAAALGMAQPTVSRHLKVLRERGLVIAERQAQSVLYSLADRRVIQALDLLRAVLADSLHSRAELARSVRNETL
jgi:DNA-binding transcriptional ArsR family regulator